MIKKMDKLIEELEKDIIDCRLDAGDGGSNVDDISCALETLEKIKAKLKNNGDLGDVSNCSHEWKADTFDNIGMPLTEYCEKCNKERDCC